MTDPVICAYDINPKGKNAKLEGAEIAKKLQAPQLAWVHLDAAHPDTRDWLYDNVPYLDDLILDALLMQETRPRISEHKNGALVILRGVNLNENESADDMISIRMWIDNNRIITTRFRKLQTIEAMRQKVESDNPPKNAGDFLMLLCTKLFIRMEPVIGLLDDRMDDVEEQFIENPNDVERSEIISIRKTAIILRRYISPQREVLSALRISDLSWMEHVHTRHAQENFDRLSRYVEDLDSIRERALIIKEEITTHLSDRMNKNMYLLSLVAAIFLPLGFITGLLGINVGGMPGVDNGFAFWIVVLICITFVGGVLAALKKMRMLA